MWNNWIFTSLMGFLGLAGILFAICGGILLVTFMMIEIGDRRWILPLVSPFIGFGLYCVGRICAALLNKYW